MYLTNIIIKVTKLNKIYGKELVASFYDQKL